jgi:hypothetical protein
VVDAALDLHRNHPTENLVVIGAANFGVNGLLKPLDLLTLRRRPDRQSTWLPVVHRPVFWPLPAAASRGMARNQDSSWALRLSALIFRDI